MEKKIKRFAKVFPWYTGFSSDLLFYIAIDSLFLTIVKNFSASEIISLTSFSQFACIALQFPIMFLIKKIGNTASIRLGASCLLISSILITVGKNYYTVLIGRTFHDVSTVLRTTSYVALENNLDLIDNRKDFVDIRAYGNTIYAVVTMIISFVASYMFNLNNYLPMIGCITTCSIGVVFAFLMTDCSPYNKIRCKKENKEKTKIRYSKFILLAIVVYSLFFLIVNSGQSDGKLFIQQHLLLDFNINNTSLIIGAIVCVSRIIRVLSNIVFVKIYRKYKGKLGVSFPIMLGSAIAFMMFGSLIPLVLVKIIVMGIGYTIILFVRDPFNLYIQDVIFISTPKEQHQTLLTILQFGVRITTAGFGLLFSAIVLHYPMITIFVLMLVIAIIDTVLGVKLYKMFNENNNLQIGFHTK